MMAGRPSQDAMHSFWRTVAFFLHLCMHTMFAQCSPDGGLMNINISQCEKSL